jgi:flagellar assembly protein FliH
LVNKVIAEATEEVGPRQRIVLRLNPDDYTHLQSLISDEVALLESSDKIARGGAVVEIVSPDGDPINKVEWDATLRSRIEYVRGALTQGAESFGVLN